MSQDWIITLAILAGVLIGAALIALDSDRRRHKKW